MTGTPKRSPAILALLLPLVTTVFMACSESPTLDDPPPTFVEHLDANGTVVRLTPPESWDGTYPVRIVQVNQDGEEVAENILKEPPTFELRMTPDHEAAVEGALEALAAQHPDEAKEIREALQQLREGR